VCPSADAAEMCGAGVRLRQAGWRSSHVGCNSTVATKGSSDDGDEMAVTLNAGGGEDGKCPQPSAHFASTCTCPQHHGEVTTIAGVFRS